MFDDRGRVVDSILDSGAIKYMGKSANKKTKQIFFKKFKMEQKRICNHNYVQFLHSCNRISKYQFNSKLVMWIGIY